MRKIILFLITLCMLILLCSCSDKNETTEKSNDYMTDDQSLTTESEEKDMNNDEADDEEENTAMITSVIDYYLDSDRDILWTELTGKDGLIYDAVVDLNGNIRYLCEESEILRYAPKNEDDIGCSNNRSTSTYTLFNAAGDVVKTFENNEWVLACGDGKALIYKCEATIDSITHLYGVVDTNGNWIVPLTDYAQKPYINNDSYGIVPFYYAGDGLFVVEIDYHSRDFMLINANTGEAFWFYTGYYGRDYDGRITFEEGVSYFMGIDAFISDIPLKNSDDEYIENIDSYATPWDFVLYADGTWKEISPSHPAANGFSKAGDQWVRWAEDYIVLYDSVSKSEIQFTKYGSDMIDNIVFEGEYGLMLLCGVDQKDYFTVIDTKGNVQFEPIPYYIRCEYGSEKISYIKDDGVWSIVDIQGNILGDNIDFEIIYPFNGEFTVAENEAYICIVNEKGEVVVDQVVLPG